MLVSKIKPCMSKYKPHYGETANGSLNPVNLTWIVNSYLDNCGNSRANTCEKPRLTEGAFIRSKPIGFGCTLGDSE